MKIIKPHFVIEDNLDGAYILKKIEKAARTCYKSEEKQCENSAPTLIRMLLKSGHESVLEHEKVTVRVICDRGVTHEIVRHRIASYSQESTRYCNYSDDKFENEISVIAACFWNSGSQEDKEKYEIWKRMMEKAEKLAGVSAGVTYQFRVLLGVRTCRGLRRPSCRSHRHAPRLAG